MNVHAGSISQQTADGGFSKAPAPVAFQRERLQRCTRRILFWCNHSRDVVWNLNRN